MKTAEEWQHDNQNMLNHGSLNQNIDLIKQIQLDAIKHGMTLASNIVSGHWNDKTHMTNQFLQAQRNADKITEARDNMKEVV